MTFKVISLSLVVLFALSGCGRSEAVPTVEPSPSPWATAVEAAPATAVPPTAAPPTSVPSNTPTLAPAATPTAAATVTETPPASPTGAATAARPRPSATPSGPLSVEVYVANCRSAPTADKPGNVVVQISIEARGGNGVYKYFDNEGVQQSSKFIDIQWEKGTRMIGKVTVTSGDGQTVSKEYDIQTGSLDCP
jgi:hypothetical protein